MVEGGCPTLCKKVGGLSGRGNVRENMFGGMCPGKMSRTLGNRGYFLLVLVPTI